MTDKDRIRICSQCKKRYLSLQKGIVCSLTGEHATFESECPDYDEDIVAAQDSESEKDAGTPSCSEENDPQEELRKLEEEKKESVGYWLFLLVLGIVALSLFLAPNLTGISNQAQQHLSRFLRIIFIIVGLFSCILALRGLKGIRLTKAYPYLPSFRVFLWLFVGLPMAFMFFRAILALFLGRSSAPLLLEIMPITLAYAALYSVYKNKTSSFSILKYSLLGNMVESVGMTVLLLVLQPFEFATSIGAFGVLAVFILWPAIGLLYLFKAKGAAVAMPIESRTPSKAGKYLFYIHIVVCAITFVSMYL